MKKRLRWQIQEIRYRLAIWRANRHIARTNAMIRIMYDAIDRQKRIMEDGEA